jgi:hypothetical protein
MRNLPISQNDIEELADNLERITQDNEEQRALLSAVIAVLADVLDPSGTSSPLVSRVPNQEAPVVVDMEGDLPSLRQQFVDGFSAEGGTGTAEGGTTAYKGDKITGVAQMKITGG